MRRFLFLVILLALVAASYIYLRRMHPPDVVPSPGVSASASPGASPMPSGSTSPAVSPGPSGSPSPAISAPAIPANIDLTVDPNNGLSKATVSMNTTQGLIRFKFYTNDAPNTVHRIAELIAKGFYNGLTFHRVVPGFVIQGGDPTGSGMGGSGQKLRAEFNERHHIEGAVAMARGPDTDSADSQFYITLSNRPDLDHHYTVFGQVIEGMDVIHRIKAGDKMVTVTLE